MLVFKGFEIEDQFACEPVTTIWTDIIYNEEYVEYMASNLGSNASNKETTEHMQRPTLPTAILTIENIPTQRSESHSGHFFRTRVTLLPLYNATVVHGRVGDLVKYYSSPNARYKGRSSDN